MNAHAIHELNTIVDNRQSVSLKTSTFRRLTQKNCNTYVVLIVQTKTNATTVCIQLLVCSWYKDSFFHVGLSHIATLSK